MKYSMLYVVCCCVRHSFSCPLKFLGFHNLVNEYKDYRKQHNFVHLTPIARARTHTHTHTHKHTHKLSSFDMALYQSWQRVDARQHATVEFFLRSTIPPSASIKNRIHKWPVKVCHIPMATVRRPCVRIA